MKRFIEKKENVERTAWQTFEQTGQVGAYLLYCAIRDAQKSTDCRKG